MLNVDTDVCDNKLNMLSALKIKPATFDSLKSITPTGESTLLHQNHLIVYLCI